MEDNKLVVLVQQSGLEKSHAQEVLDNFIGFFESAKKWEIEARGINVTDMTQTGLMSKAREIRLQLKDIRVNAEKVRKELKEQSLREGKAIDGIANIIKALVVPLEEHLEKQEKFVELKIAKELDERNTKRIAELTPFVTDVTFYNLRDMDEESYKKLLVSSMEAFKAQKKAEKEAEEERIRKEKEDREERIRIQKENEKLREEARKKNEEIARIRKEEEEKRRKENEERIAREQEEAKKRKEQEKDKLEAEMLDELDFLFEDISDDGDGDMQLTEEGKRVYDFIIKFIQ